MINHAKTKERIVVRMANKIFQADVDGWDAMTFIACLSSDPRTFDELVRSWDRYRDEPLTKLPWRENREEPKGTLWTVADLVCQRVISGGGSAIPSDGRYREDDDESQASPIYIHHRPNWMQLEDSSWEDAFAPLPVPSEPLDVRGILFGRPLAETLSATAIQSMQRDVLPSVRLTWEELRDGLRENQRPSEAQKSTANQWHQMSVQVHKDFLLTPRDDLEGQTPRSLLYSDWEWVEREVNDRRDQWVREGSQPRGLDHDTFAYRFGPIGICEVVMHFGLCRAVIDQAWDQLTLHPRIEKDELTNRLADYADRWLNTNSESDDPIPPAKIIETERRLIPLISKGPLHPDCPICQAEADGVFGSGPTFIMYDGHSLELDDESAFSLDSVEEWQARQDDEDDDASLNSTTTF